MTHQRLVKDCLQGDRSSQKLLYEEFAGSALGVCYRYTKSMADAEDILQESFIKVFRNLHQFRFDGELGAWIRRIVVNTAINYLKKDSAYQSELSFTDTSLHPVASDDPAVALDAKDLAALIRQLPPGYQMIFNLHAVDGYRHEEIGKLLGIKSATSRSQYAKARALLIQWINRHSSREKTQQYARS